MKTWQLTHKGHDLRVENGWFFINCQIFVDDALGLSGRFWLEVGAVN